MSRLRPFQKTVILIGGNGEYGRLLTKKFSETWIKRWKVMSIDSDSNPGAYYNFEMDIDQPWNKESIEELHEYIKETKVQ